MGVCMYVCMQIDSYEPICELLLPKIGIYDSALPANVFQIVRILDLGGCPEVTNVTNTEFMVGALHRFSIKIVYCGLYK